MLRNSPERLSVRHASGTVGYSHDLSRRIFIESAAVEHPAIASLSYSTPLLEEEWHSCVATLVADGHYPFFAHGTGARAALAAHDHPVDSGEVEFSQIFEQRFDR